MAGAVNRGRGLCFEESATGAFFLIVCISPQRNAFFGVGNLRRHGAPFIHTSSP